MAEHRADRADATTRSARTLAQGLAVDVLVAVAVALLAWLPDADITTTEAWLVLGTAVAKSGLTAVASYVARLAVPPAAEEPLEH
ncbi:hypothetical protein ACOACO_17365 [Nocardioides sp. CPCC 205120]|uniref:hypothetical protein n=1 Tax=Nocardioides sp. CPCC 205120 TaxID=3406462 RepID=UPI003B50FBDB